MKKNYCPRTWFLTVIFSFVLFNLVQGQEYNVINLLPPAPNAASLSKFAGVNTGLSSGTANFSIPLFNYTSKNISIPVSVSYTTSGFKVDEIASRVGNQWALNAGGVITRTVLGSVDETSTRIHPKPSLGGTTQFDLFQFEQKLCNSLPIQGVGPGGAVDGQPDMFSFNFDKYSGKFILDTIGINHTLQPVMLSNLGLKIERTSPLTFVITTPEGVQYLFGGSDATEQTESSSCGPMYTQNLTAWYLKQIIHPNGDAATFYYSPLTYTYKTGISQTIYKSLEPGVTHYACQTQNPVSAPSPTPYFCSNLMQTTGVLLDSITSTHGGKIKFDYVTRTDNNDRLVSAISLYSPDRAAVVKTFSLGYTYSSSRPFLTSLTEANGAATVLAKHKFGYNDIEHIPAALSYAQDYWGYSNGKTTNTTMIPKPDDPVFQQNLPAATADRHPDPVYAQKGLLNSVTYPTGGKDSVLYEGNQSYQLTTTYPEDQLMNYTATNNTGSNNSTFHYISTTTAVISVSQQVTFSGSCTALSTTFNSTRQVRIEILDINNNVVTNATILPGATASTTLILGPGTYKLGAVLYGDYVRARVTLKYFSGAQTSQEMNRNIGGVRVAKILTYDGVSANPMVKKYNYNKWSDPTQSSAGVKDIPSYERIIKLWVQCTSLGLCSSGASFDFAMSTSSAPYSLFVTPTPATYANVTESFGENFENGGIEHQFTVWQDRKAAVYSGIRIDGAPNTNTSYKNGLETYQGTFKVQEAQRIYSRKTYTHYLEDTVFAKRYTGYIGTENYHIYCVEHTVNSERWQMECYNTSYYFIDKAWVYADTVRTQTYDLSGQNYVQNIKAYEYNNVENAQPTLVTNYDSNGAILKTTFSYPSDFAVTPYTTMVGKHILSPVIIKTNYENTTPLQSIKTNYSDWGNNIFAPLTVETRLGAAAYEARLHYFGYDDMGNVLSVSKEGGSKTAYVWGYNGLYPIAKLDNAEYSTVTTALGGATVIQNFRNKPKPTNTELATYLAPLRTNTGLKSALVITNTYDPVNGLSETTDTKGSTTTYEYDAFQRLLNIKDKAGNIVKSFTYHYAGQ